MNSVRIAALVLTASTAFAQVPDAPLPAPGAPAPAASGNAPVGQTPGSAPAAKPANNSPLGNEVPILDPGTEVVTFNGKHWNVANNRIFQARFEKYLNAPEATAKEDAEYRAIVERILQLLAPGNATTANVDAAFKLLPYGSRYDIDAHLCDSLADAVYAVWQAQRNQARLANANAALEDELKKLEWNLQTVTDGRKLQAPPTTGGGTRSNTGGGGRQGNNTPPQGGGQVNPANSTDYQTAGYTRRHAERLIAIKTNQVKRELSELEAKVGFHTLMVQFLAQRRFQHVIMATRFYRALFTDGDTKLNLGKDMTEAIQRSTGMPPTVSIIDSLANEAMRDVREGVKAFDYLLTKTEMQGATMRLQEAFVVGEFMPDVRLVSRDKKRQCLEFSQKSFQLISAIDSRDYGRAETIIKDLKKAAKDFDDTKPTAAVEGARLLVRKHLAEARLASINNNQAEVHRAMTAAGEVWPFSPELQEASDKLLKQGDSVLRTMTEFEDLIRQKNLRHIWNNKLRFGIVMQDPKYKETFEKVMADMELIEYALREAAARARQNDFSGAWEVLRKSAHDFPNDPVLTTELATCTIRASAFVTTINNAEDLEKKEQYGSSLAHYLKAQRLYPASEFAKDGITRLSEHVLPAKKTTPES
jgi:hypothetical protein